MSSGGVLFTSQSLIEIGDPIEYLVTLPSTVSAGTQVRIRCMGKVTRTETREEAVELVSERPYRIAATLAGSAIEPTNGSTLTVAEPNASADQSTSFGTVLGEAEAVKTSLREAHSRVSRLIVTLKRHRQQSKLMRSTLESLKQLKALDV